MLQKTANKGSARPRGVSTCHKALIRPGYKVARVALQMNNNKHCQGLLGALKLNTSVEADIPRS